MQTAQTSLLAALLTLLGVHCQHSGGPSRNGQAVAASQAADSMPRQSDSTSSSRRRQPIYQAVKGKRFKEMYASGGYIPREFLSIKQRRLEDEKFVKFLQENKAHHERLKNPLFHAKETFALRDKAPASSIQGVYVKQLRRHYKSHQQADKAFVDRFMKEYRALHRQQYNRDYRRGRKRPRNDEEEIFKDDIAKPDDVLQMPDWGAKKRRTVRYLVEGEDIWEDRGIKYAKGLK